MILADDTKSETPVREKDVDFPLLPGGNLPCRKGGTGWTVAVD